MNRVWNRLWVRLTVAFIVVTQLSIFVVAALANWTVTGEFRTYVIRREFSSDGVPASSLFYTQWSAPLSDGPFWPFAPGKPASLDTQVQAADRVGVSSGGVVQAFASSEQATVVKFLPLLADSKGTVIYDPGKLRVGTALDKTELAVSLPIKQNGANGAEGKLVGYLYPNPSVAAPMPPPDIMFKSPENAFIYRLSTPMPAP